MSFRPCSYCYDNIKTIRCQARIAERLAPPFANAPGGSDPNRCGKDYENCHGLDKEDILAICPKQALTACYENGQNKSAKELEDMITGLLLNVDNAQLAACEAEIEKKMLEVCEDTVTCSKAPAFLDKSFGALDSCPMTVINGQSVNEDDYANSSNSSSSSGHSSGGVKILWWKVGGYSNSASNSSYSSKYSDDHSDDTSMTLRTFRTNPEEDENAQYCAMIKITNTKATNNTSENSGSGSANSNNSTMRFFWSGSRGSSSANRQSSGSSSSVDAAAYTAVIAFAYTPDYNKIEIKDKEVKTDDEGEVTGTTVVVPLASFAVPTPPVAPGTSPAAAPAATHTRMEERVVETINGVIQSISESPKVSRCLYGRDMSQIRAKRGADSDAPDADDGKNTARFPRMFDSYAKMIIRDGKAQATKNYEESVKDNKKKLKEQAIQNIKGALNQSDYSEEEKKALVDAIEASIKAL